MPRRIQPGSGPADVPGTARAGFVPRNRPLVGPLYLAAGWTFDSVAESEALYAGAGDGVTYGTLGGPNQRDLEAEISSLEDTQAAVVTPGGMAAIALALQTFLVPGDRVVAAVDLFGPTIRLLEWLRQRWQVHTTYHRLDPKRIRRMKPSPRLIYAETISNPRLRIADIEGLSEVARDVGALLVVDNTLASPAACRPCRLGADLTIESATKMLAGHSDVVLGVVTGQQTLIEQCRSVSVLNGQVADAHSSWLALRGLATYAVRFDRASTSAGAIARWLAQQPQVVGVDYPLLPDHPDASVAARTLASGGTVVGFDVGSRTAAERMIAALDNIPLASSFAGTRTTLVHPATSTHHTLGHEQLREQGIGEGLLRLSVGLEEIRWLQGELSRALSSMP